MLLLDNLEGYMKEEFKQAVNYLWCSLVWPSQCFRSVASSKLCGTTPILLDASEQSVTNSSVPEECHHKKLNLNPTSLIKEELAENENDEKDEKKHL